MLADQLGRTWAVTIGLAKHDPTNQKTVHERLKSMWQVGFREDRNFVRPSRSDMGPHDRSSKTRPDKPEISSRVRETPKYTAGGFRRE